MTNHAYSLLTIHPNFLAVTPNYILPNRVINRFRKRNFEPIKKGSIKKRNLKIISIGHSVLWKTFLTLTLNSDYYWSDYDKIQSQFRSFTKSLRYSVGKFRYLAVLEHGEKTLRVHYHMLTDIDFENKIFDYSENYKKLGKKDRKICKNWTFGWSDVVKVQNDNCNAVFYLCKYLSKKNILRTPIGKREVFCSKGLNHVHKIVTKDPEKLLKNHKILFDNRKTKIYIKKYPRLIF